MKDIYNVVKSISVERSDDVMTIAEQLIQEEMEKGEYKKAKEMAIELLNDGVEIALVAKYTKLTKEEVKKIKEEL